MQAKPFHVIGLDGIGAEVVRRIARQKAGAVSFLELYSKKPSIIPSSLPSLHVYKMKAGYQEDIPITRKSISKKQKLEIRQAIADAGFLIIVSEINGNSDTGLMIPIAQLASEMGFPVLLFVAYPYAFDDLKIRSKVDKAVRNLENAGISAVLTNGKMSNEADIRRWFEPLLDEVAFAITGITELVTFPGLINLDLQDVKDVLLLGSRIRFGFATESGEQREIRAAQKAMETLNMSDTELKSSTSVLINFTAKSFLSMREISVAANLIWEAMGQEPEIIFGTVLKEEMADDELSIRIYVAEG